jgi:ribosomal protein S18 acetylase RimI-like enzyme
VSEIALRPATPEDQPFLTRVYASTREAELAVVPWSDEQRAAFLAQQFAAQSLHYSRQFPSASFDVVLVDGEPAGRLIVQRSADEVHVVDVSLLPEHRSRGIGTRLLQALIDEGAKLSLSAERTNPALRLYARLGFAVVADDGMYVSLERPPAAAQAKTAS